MGVYTVGVDFGTLSARALLLDAQSGEELAEAVSPYAHGVMDAALPDGTPLPPQYALQHPGDYVEALRASVGEVLETSGIDPREVVGLCVDFTCCTLLSLDENGVPLCCDPAFQNVPLAHVLLWKHHAAQPYANELTRLLAARAPDLLAAYGGRVSGEWLFPKIMQIAHEAPDVFRRTARFCEAGDWITGRLIGRAVNSATYAGLKAFWNERDGYPANALLREADPALDGIVGTKISPRVDKVGSLAGRLTEAGAAMTGLSVGTAVAVPVADAHAAMPALGIEGDGDLAMILGTSIVHLVNCAEEKPIPGVCARVKDGVVPGRTTYEAGQSGGGDIFDWFVRTQVPARYAAEAAARGVSVHQLLREKAGPKPAGASGLLALDWVNGSRSPYQNGDLSGAVLGLTMTTAPEDVYRAWIEATAYGTRTIIDNFEANGVPVRSVCATGGIARKDPMLMQIFADVTGRPIRVGGASQAGARGSAIYAAAAGGVYGNVSEAIRALRVPDVGVFEPRPREQATYRTLYAAYRRLCDRFALGGDDTMQLLADLRRNAKKD